MPVDLAKVHGKEEIIKLLTPPSNGAAGVLFLCLRMREVSL
jgi:hypothetical protein